MLTLKDPAIADAALARPRGALPPARHRRARGADPQGRPRDDRRRTSTTSTASATRATDDAGARAGRRRRVRRRLLHGADPGRRGSRRSPRPARACRRSRPTSSPRSRPGCCSTRSPSSAHGRRYDADASGQPRLTRDGSMKATARRDGHRHSFKQQIEVRGHRSSPTSRTALGGDDDGPEPAGAARRQPRVVHRGHDGDVRQAQGLGPRTGRGQRRVLPAPSAAARPGSRSRCGCRASLTEEQVERLQVIAAKCPVHRTLDGEVMFDERVELATPPGA